MQAVSLSGLKTHEYVYILPWLQAEAKDASPWIGADGQMVQNVKEFFTGSIIVCVFCLEEYNILLSINIWV